jgi:hypothetical protein
MTATSRKAAILTDYVFGIGLRLSLQLQELFDIEVGPIIEAATTSDERSALQDGWRTILRSRSGESSAAFRYWENSLCRWEKGKITLGRERVLSMLSRQLRNFEFIAVGSTEVLGEVGPLALIMPRRWDSLIVTWGSDTVTDDLAVIRDVHVAKVERLREAQRRELDELLYTLSKQRFADTTEGSRDGGRPPRQSEMVKAWIKQRSASKLGMPEKEEVARAQALKHFETQIEEKLISGETIRTTIKAFYTAQN